MAAKASNAARIGIPWRTSPEELKQERPKLQNYEEAVRRAGGEPVVLPLSDTAGLGRLLSRIDGFVLPGSPADVEPEEYGARNSGLSEPADKPRERADRAILEHAFREEEAGTGNLLWVSTAECVPGGDADPGLARRVGYDDGAPEEGCVARGEGRSRAWRAV